METTGRASQGDGSGGIGMAESTERFAGKTPEEITAELARFLQETLERERQAKAHRTLRKMGEDA